MTRCNAKVYSLLSCLAVVQGKMAINYEFEYADKYVKYLEPIKDNSKDRKFPVPSLESEYIWWDSCQAD